MSDLVPMEEILKQQESNKKINETSVDFSKYINNKYDQAIKNNSFSDLLSSDYDRIKADTNHDGKISKEEYDLYTLNTYSNKPTILDQNIKENHNYFHFDYSILLAVSIVCVTIIIAKWMQYRNKKII